MKPAKHGRDHASGGEDPIPGLGDVDLKWARIGAGTQLITPVGNDYRLTFTDGRSNSEADYDLVDITAGRANWLQISTPGYYLAWFSAVHAVLPPTTFERFIEPLFDLSGTPAAIQENQGVADALGSYKTRETMFLAGETETLSMFTELTFNWNPDSPVSDLDFEDPLKIGLHVATTSDTTARSIGGEVFVMRIASAGYVDLGP